MRSIAKLSILLALIVSCLVVQCSNGLGLSVAGTDLLLAASASDQEAPTIIENNNKQDLSQDKKASSPLDIVDKYIGDGSATSNVTSNAATETQTTLDGTGTSSNATISSARTFDGWTNCVGNDGGKYGTCKNDVQCRQSKGIPDGSCMGGLGVCCVMALTCGDKSQENNTFFANPDFPDPSWEARLCEVEIKKKSKTLQIMIEFEEFELAPPNHNGECITDAFQVKLADHRPSPYTLLRICGQNTGQHMYLDVSQVDVPIILSVATSGGGFPRRWSIRIVHMDEKNQLLAPPGCLQYYTDTVGHFRSFNLGKNLRNLYYAICFRIDNGYSGIRFTENFFGMNGAVCRKKDAIKSHRLPHVHGVPRIEGQYPSPHHLQPYQHQHQNHHQHQPPLPPPPPPPQQYPQQHHHQYSPPPPPSAQPYTGSPPNVSGYGSSPPVVSPPSVGYTSAPAQATTSTTAGGRYKREGAPANDALEPEPVAPEPSTDRSPQPEKRQQAPEQQLQPQATAQNQDQNQTRASQESEAEQPPTKAEQTAQNETSNQKTKQASSARTFSHDKEDKDEFKEEKHHEKDYHKAVGYGYGQPPHYHQHKEGGYGPPPQGYGPHQYGLPNKGAYENEYGPPPNKPAHHLKHHEHLHHHQYEHPYPYHQHHHPYQQYGAEYGYDDKYEYKHEKYDDKDDKKDEKKGNSWWPWGSGSKEKDKSGKDKKDDKKKNKYTVHHEALFPVMRMFELPHCEPRFCGLNDVITFPPSGESLAEMCGNKFNRGHGPKIISGTPLVVYVSNRGTQRGSGFDMNYEQVFFIPRPY